MARRPFGSGRGGAPYRRGGYTTWENRRITSRVSPPPLGTLLEAVKVLDLNEPAEKLKGVAKITQRTLVASFNWLDRDEPTIAIPGRPPRWSPLTEPIQIPDDNGNYDNRPCRSTRREFRDANAARFPKHPMEPAIVAAFAMEPGLCSEHLLDVVACGSTIGSLLRFIKGQDKSFRMLVEVVGDAVFFVRRENSPTELIPDLQGFGHSFPEHYTTWDPDVKGSKSHQRIMRYRFGGMNFLVRFEGDGYIAAPGSSQVAPKKSEEIHLGQASSAASLDDLAASLSTTRVSTGLPKIGSPDAMLKIEMTGQTIDPSLIFDLKTRSHKKVLQLEETIEGELPRLWAAGINNFVVAFHNRNVFDDIRIMQVGDMVEQWEADNQQTLAELAALIHHVKALARDRPDGKLELCHSEAGILEIREQLPDAGDALSATTRDLWLDSALQWDEDADGVEIVNSSTDNEGTDDEGSAIGWDDGEHNDFTACSADSCGYCGRCTY